MQRRSDSKLLFSPSDLTRYMDSPFASWVTRFNLENPALAIPKEDSPDELVILQERGLEHEARFLQQLEESDQQVRTIQTEGRAKDDMAAETLEAMRAGHDVIFQAYLRSGSFAGYADFLYKVPGPSALGEHHYEPWDTKLALSVKPYFMVQLCCYAELLEEVQGLRPGHLGVILGDGRQEPHRTADFFFSYQAVKDGFLAQMAGDFSAEAEPPLPQAGADHKPFGSYAEDILLGLDHLSQVAGMRRRQTAKLEEVGITTMTALAETSLQRVPGLRDDIFERLQEQASLQVGSRGLERPLYRVLPPPEGNPIHGLGRLPPPARLDVFFDMEGFPLAPGGLEYLFGVTTRGAAGLEFKAFWAHDKVQEKRAFEAFIDWVIARWQDDPAMHIYHYAPYEVTAMRKLMGEHATREDEVDQLLRRGVFIDLYKVVREGLRVGEPSYSIKNLEHLYWHAREGEVQSGGASIAQYHHWTVSGESADISTSPLLEAIHDYNRDDCDSTLALYDWLRARAGEAGPDDGGGGEGGGDGGGDPQDGAEDEPEPEPDPEPELSEEVLARRALRAQILATVPDDVAQNGTDDERLSWLLGELLEFHRREEKPMWWRRFDRLEKSADELAEDADCIGGLTRRASPPVALGRGSVAYWYDFPGGQETKISVGSKVILREAPELRGTIAVQEMDSTGPGLLLKLGRTALSELAAGGPPHEISLLPRESSRAGPLKDTVFEVISAWHEGGTLPPALEQFLRRRAPSLSGGQQLVRQAGESASQAAVRLTCCLDEATLCVQGPPGAGKTYTAARMILAALASGKRVGVTSNSHKAIQNLLTACCKAAREAGTTVQGVKVDSNPGKPFFEKNPEVTAVKPAQVEGLLGQGTLLVGATAWTFARPELAGSFDLLFVDEAGQVSLANLVAMSRATSSMVLLGDQRQLAQPIQGTHPGDTGLSALNYLLQDQATISDELGIFLDKTWRLHPDICAFISDAFYEGRLGQVDQCAQRAVVAAAASEADLPRGTGLRFIPIVHEGNTVGSEEEASEVARLVDHLLSCRFTEDGGASDRPIQLSDILVVAPYNVQVGKLQHALPAAAQVGTVDRFQGQEAPVVILSMSCSDLQDAQRGAAFLFDPNRLNVALSRAQALAIVVASPALGNPACASLEQLRLSNLFCRITYEAR
jgi:uncharacterized protein